MIQCSIVRQLCYFLRILKPQLIVKYSIHKIVNHCSISMSWFTKSSNINTIHKCEICVRCYSKMNVLQVYNYNFSLYFYRKGEKTTHKTESWEYVVKHILIFVISQCSQRSWISNLFKIFSVVYITWVRSITRVTPYYNITSSFHSTKLIIV